VKDYIGVKFIEKELDDERNKNLEEGASKNKIKNGLYYKYND